MINLVAIMVFFSEKNVLYIPDSNRTLQWELSIIERSWESLSLLNLYFEHLRVYMCVNGWT